LISILMGRKPTTNPLHMRNGYLSIIKLIIDLGAACRMNNAQIIQLS
jgi:hypothetical protein